MQTITKKIFLSLLFFLPFLVNSAFSNPIKDKLAFADSLFLNHEYTEAFENYTIILENHNYFTPQMLLRMAYVKEGLEEFTYALYYLNLYYNHKADKKVLHKMSEIAEKQKLKGYKFSDYEYITSFYHKHFSKILLTCFALFALTLVYIFKSHIKKHNIIPPGITLVVILSSFFVLINFGLKNKKGIIKNNQVNLMTSPSAGSELVTTINSGHRINLKGQEDIWYKTEWDGEIAYIRKSNLLIIK